MEEKPKIIKTAITPRMAVFYAGVKLAGYVICYALGYGAKKVSEF